MSIRLLPTAPATPLVRLVDDYLITCRARGLSPRTDQQYSYALHGVFLPWCAREGIEDPAQLDRRTLDRFSSMLLEKRTESGAPLSRASVHTYLRPLRLLLTWAAREGEPITARPQLPRQPKPVRDVLSRDEIDQMERSLPNERDRLILRVFADCGLRLRELAGLEASGVIRSGRQAHLRVLGKRDRIRDVPVPPSLLRRLDRLIQSRPAARTCDNIFLSHRRGAAGEYGPLLPEGAYRVVKDAVARAGITKRTYPHLLRHSWMTEMLRNGMNPIQLSFIAGASPEVIQQHYAHLTKDDAYDAMLRALAARGAGARRGE